MKVSSRFSPLITCIVLLISCHGISSSNDPVYDTQAPISRLGESSIGPQYRERRSEESFVNEVDGDLGQSGQNEVDDYDSDNEQDGQEDDGEYEGDGQYDTEDTFPSLTTDSSLKESLNLLKNTRKTLGRYVREDGALNKLMVESSELAKEVGQVFHQLAKREVGLQKQMKSLKEALNGAVVTLKNTFKKEEKIKDSTEGNEIDGESGEKVDDEETTQTLPRQPRHLNLHKNPYRACVEIERISSDEEVGVSDRKASAASHYKSLYQEQQQQRPPPPPPLPPAAVQEYMPSRQELQNAQRFGQSSSFSTQQQRVSVQSDNRNNDARMTSNYPQPGKNPAPPLSQVQPPPSRPLVPPPATRPLPLPMTARSQMSRSQASQSQTSQSQASQLQKSQSQFQSSNNVANANMNRNAAISSSSATRNTNPNTIPNPTSQQNMNDVDLSEVYWLRLNPERKQEMLHKKLDALLKEKQNQGRDVLVIPLTHGLHNTEEVKNGFLRAVRVRPSALKKKLFRQLRSLQVREL